jgi:hypothetical protein
MFTRWHRNIEGLNVKKTKPLGSRTKWWDKRLSEETLLGCWNSDVLHEVMLPQMRIKRRNEDAKTNMKEDIQKKKKKKKKMMMMMMMMMMTTTMRITNGMRVAPKISRRT